MSRDDLERIYLMSCVSEEFREVLEHLSRIENGVLRICCLLKEIVWLQLEITRVIDANPQCFAIREIVYFSEAGTICYPVGIAAR